MRVGLVGRIPRRPPLLIVSLLAVGMLFLGRPQALVDKSPTLLHDEPAPSAHTEAVVHSVQELTFYPDLYEAGLVHLMVDVAVDEDFIRQVGPDWESQTLRMVAGANLLLRQIGVDLSVASVRRWQSNDHKTSVAALLDDAEGQVGRQDGNLLLAITCQDTVQYDGWAQGGLGRVIVQFYHDNDVRNSALIAHEVGHVLGAGHHEDENECDEGGCIMDRAGYAHATEWCDHHRRIIQEYIALALALPRP